MFCENKEVKNNNSYLSTKCFILNIIDSYLSTKSF